jgi:hypothetical protein
MGKDMKRKRKQGDRLPPFVPLLWNVLNSQAYKELPPSAAKALPYFIGKVKLKPNEPDRYERSFPFSYSEGRNYGFAKATFSRTIKDLVRIGFIDPVDKGGLRGDGKSTSRFKLSRRWETYGTDKFEPLDWKCFIPKPRNESWFKK